MNQPAPFSSEHSPSSLARNLSQATSAFQSHAIQLPAGENILPSPAFKADGTSLAELTLKFLQSILPNRSFSKDSLEPMAPSDILWSWLSPAQMNAARSAALVKSIIHAVFDNAPGLEENPRLQHFISVLSTHFASEQSASPLGMTPDIPLVQTDIIYGTPTPRQPDNGLSLEQRRQGVKAYADRLRSSLANTEKGSQAQRNIHFMTHQPFLRPEGYYSAGLLAAGLDPQEKTTVIYTGAVRSLTSEERITSRYERNYAAWEIAAGMHRHDQPDNSGSLLNFHYEQFRAGADRQRVKNLEALGQDLTGRWLSDVLTSMDTPASAQARRSGKAAAYQVKSILANLRRDPLHFGKMTSAAQQAVIRTLDDNGQVIIPNIYGYPLEGYAFIPFQPYKATGRPNQGLMLDLLDVTANEIDSDDAFARWVGNHLNTLLQRFNSIDAQGGRDAHWPSAPSLLRLLTTSPSSYLERPVFQGTFAVRQAFNYTGSATSGYQLKHAPFDGIATLYTQLNVRNVQALSQTQVFSSAQQNWRTAQRVWSSTFAYLPIVGNLGNIVFAIHDAITGMSVEERLGGSVAILVSALQLAHETPSLILPSSTRGKVGTPEFGWKSAPRTDELRFSYRPEGIEASAGEPVLKPNHLSVEQVVERPLATSHPAEVTDPAITARVMDDGSVVELGDKSYIRIKGSVFESRSSLVALTQRVVIDPQNEMALFHVYNGRGKWEKLAGLKGGGQCFGRLCQASPDEIEMELQPMYRVDEQPPRNTVLLALSKAQRLRGFADEVGNLSDWLGNPGALDEFRTIYLRERPNPHGFWGPAQSYTDWQAITQLVRDDPDLLPLKDVEHSLPNEMLDSIRKKFTDPPHPSLALDEEAGTRALFEKTLIPPTAATDLAYLVEHRLELGSLNYVRRILFKYGLTATQLRLCTSGSAGLRQALRAVIDARYPTLKERADILFESYEFDLHSNILTYRQLDAFFGWLESDAIATEKFRLIVQCIDADAVPVPLPQIYQLGKSQKIDLLNALTEQQLSQRLEGVSTVAEKSSGFWKRLSQRNYVIERSAEGEPVAILNWSFFKLKKTPIFKEAGQFQVREQWWPDMLGKRYATFEALEQDVQRQLGGIRQTATVESITTVAKPVLAPVAYEIERAPEGTPLAVFYRTIRDAQTRRMPIVDEAGKLFVVNSDPHWFAVSDRAFSTLEDLERAIRHALIDPLMM